jgi:hypothetical protein
LLRHHVAHRPGFHRRQFFLAMAAVMDSVI